MLIKGNTVLIPEVSNKQNHLVAGDNITLENINDETLISAVGGGGLIKSPFNEEKDVFVSEEWNIEQSQSEAFKTIISDIIDFIGFKINLSFYTDDTKTSLIGSATVRYDFLSKMLYREGYGGVFYDNRINLGLNAATNATFHLQNIFYNGEYDETPTGTTFEFMIGDLDIPNSGIGYISSQFELITSKDLKVG